MIDASIRPTSYTLHFMIKCLLNGKDYHNLQKLFEIWHHFGLCNQTRMEYWHLKTLLSLLIEQNDRPDLALSFLKLTHDLKLFDYKENDSDITDISDVIKEKDYEIQQEIIRKLCLYGVKNVNDINSWIKFATSNWNMDKIEISNAVIGQILFWNEIHDLKGMMDICKELNIDPTKIEIDGTIIKVLLSNMRRKSNQKFAYLNEYHYSIIDGLELFNFALNEYPDTFRPNIQCFNQLFAMIKSHDEIKIANKLLKDMKENYPDVIPDKNTAINLLRLLYFNPTNLNINEQKSGHQILNELIKMGLPSNPIHQSIYHELIQLHAYYNDFPGFLLTLYKMKAENQAIEDISIDETMDEIMDEMDIINHNHGKLRKIDIDENTFEPIIEGILLNKLATNGQVDNCCLILDEMIECGYRPSGPVYRDIIDNMGKNGYSQQALQMIDRALLDGIIFNDRIWRYWMLSFAKSGQIQSCLLLLDKMDRSNNVRFINTRHFNGLLYAYYQNNNLDGIRKTYDYMINITKQKHDANNATVKLSKMNIKPNIKSYHIIAKSFLENNQSEDLKNLLDSMEHHDIPLDWKMHSIALQNMLNEPDITWQTVQDYLSSVISSKKVFPRQPMVDDILSGSIQLNVLSEGLNFIHQAFDDPDLRTSTLPSENILGKFITNMFLKSDDHNHQLLYRGILPYLMEKYNHIFTILTTKLPPKSKKDHEDQQYNLLKQQKSDLSNFKLKPKKLLQSALFTLEDHFDPLTCTLKVDNIDCRQLLVDILRHLFAPIDELKTSKQKSDKSSSSYTSYTDEQLLSAYFPIIQDILKQSVKDRPNLVLLASSQLSIPIKPGLFTKMIHSLVFNGNVETIQSISSIIDQYYNSNAANPYIEYFQYEPDEISMDQNNSKQPDKPWLISSKSEWTFLPFQMIDSFELERIGMKISDLILFDALLFDNRLNEALKHLSSLHKDQKISYIIIKQIIQRTLNYLELTKELKINDKEYVSKVSHTLSIVLNQIPTTNDAINTEIKSKTKQSIERKKKNLQETNEIFECIWNEGGFIRGAMILQGLLIKLDDKHCLQPHLQKFCANEFSKLTQYGLLQPETDEQSTMLLGNEVEKQSFLSK